MRSKYNIVGTHLKKTIRHEDINNNYLHYLK